MRIPENLCASRFLNVSNSSSRGAPEVRENPKHRAKMKGPLDDGEGEWGLHWFWIKIEILKPYVC